MTLSYARAIYWQDVLLADNFAWRSDNRATQIPPRSAGGSAGAVAQARRPIFGAAERR